MSHVRRTVPLLLAILIGLPLAGCSDDDDGGTAPPEEGPFALTFAGDASFQGPHGGQEIHVAVVRTGSNVPGGSEVVAYETGIVSASADPAFSFTFSDVLEEGQDYEVHYWIDSNFMGGAVGLCDSTDDDHQWRVELGMPEGDVSHTESHEPAETEAVCSTFTFDLEFAGDATFQGPHGGQTIHLAVIRSSDQAVVTRETGTVSASSDPAFDFQLPGVLVREAGYDVAYWIDSNFMGGAEGECDAPDDDHQWLRSIGSVTENVSHTETHEPAETTSVCSFFE